MILIPALRHKATASLTSLRGGSCMAIKPIKVKFFSTFSAVYSCKEVGKERSSLFNGR